MSEETKIKEEKKMSFNKRIQKTPLEIEEEVLETNEKMLNNMIEERAKLNLDNKIRNFREHGEQIRKRIQVLKSTSEKRPH